MTELTDVSVISVISAWRQWSLVKVNMPGSAMILNFKFSTLNQRITKNRQGGINREIREINPSHGVPVRVLVHSRDTSVQ